MESSPTSTYRRTGRHTALQKRQGRRMPLKGPATGTCRLYTAYFVNGWGQTDCSPHTPTPIQGGGLARLGGRMAEPQQGSAASTYHLATANTPPRPAGKVGRWVDEGVAKADEGLCHNRPTCPHHPGRLARSADGWTRGAAEANDRLCHNHLTCHSGQLARSADGRTRGVAEANDRLCHDHLTRLHHSSQPARSADGWTKKLETH